MVVRCNDVLRVSKRVWCAASANAGSSEVCVREVRERGNAVNENKRVWQNE